MSNSDDDTISVEDNSLKKSGRKLVKYCSAKFQKYSPRHIKESRRRKRKSKLQETLFKEHQKLHDRFVMRSYSKSTLFRKNVQSA